MKQDLIAEIKIPEGIEVKVDDGIFTAKGSKGEVSKNLANPKINIDIKDKKVVISSKKATKREKTMIGTFKSHIKNILEGVKGGYVYKLKICSTHFPMTAAVNNGEFSVQNFLGEKIPRTFKILPGVDVKIEGQEITIESPDKEAAGQTAASVEQLCRITNKDKRIFQDGIYMVSKAEKNE